MKKLDGFILLTFGLILVLATIDFIIVLILVYNIAFC